MVLNGSDGTFGGPVNFSGGVNNWELGNIGLFSGLHGDKVFAGKFFLGEVNKLINGEPEIVAFSVKGTDERCVVSVDLKSVFIFSSRVLLSKGLHEALEF